MDKNLYATLDRLNSYELHQKRLDHFKRNIETIKLAGAVQADPGYLQVKKNIMAIKIKTHEYNENKRIGEIKRNNQLLLGKLLEISRGKASATNQKNLKVPRGASKSLNYLSKKREAERIDRENAKILDRILNVKCTNQVHYDRQIADFQHVHLKQRKMLQDKNQGVYVEDLLEKQHRYRVNVHQKSTMLPNISQSEGSGSNLRGNNRYSELQRKAPTANSFIKHSYQGDLNQSGTSDKRHQTHVKERLVLNRQSEDNFNNLNTISFKPPVPAKKEAVPNKNNTDRKESQDKKQPTVQAESRFKNKNSTQLDKLILSKIKPEHLASKEPPKQAGTSMKNFSEVKRKPALAPINKS